MRQRARGVQTTELCEWFQVHCANLVYEHGRACGIFEGPSSEDRETADFFARQEGRRSRDHTILSERCGAALSALERLAVIFTNLFP